MVEKPELVEFAVEEICPYERNGENHEKVCRQCGTMDRTCAGQFVACSGCCDLKKSQRVHSCGNIKKYLTIKNSVTLDCDDRIEYAPGKVTVTFGDDTTKREEQEADTLYSKCEVDERIANLGAVLTPMKAKFSCDECAETDVPDLLEQCCKKARAYPTEAEEEYALQGMKLFVYAPGCEHSTLTRFPDLTEEQVDKDLDAYIESNYCSKSVNWASDKCGNGYSRRLGSSGWANSWPSNSSRHLASVEGCSWLEEDGETDAANPLSFLSPMVLATCLAGSLV